MTRIQRTVTAALVAIAATIILLWTPAQETWGQENTPPVIGTPESLSLQYLFPKGEKAVLEFSSEPVTDAESDTTNIEFVFTVPDVSTDNPTDTTDPSDTPLKDTSDHAEALFKLTRNGHNFEFTAKDEFTPEDFTTLYGNVVSHEIPVKMYANDGTQDSEPLSFTITAYHDASPQFQFHHEETYQPEQRWELDKVIEVYEGPQANSELGKIILGSYDEENNPTGGQPARISGITDALQVPWTSTKGGERTWTLGNRDGTANSPKVRCEDQSGTTTQTWDSQGSQDSALFAIDLPEGNQQEGHISLRFTSVPDFEDPQDHDQDNEYLVRLVNDHDIHRLGTEDATLGCNGSALDLKIRVKDVGPPAPPTGFTAKRNQYSIKQLDLSWDHPVPNQFMEGGERTDFPDPSFNVDRIIISHSPDGLRHRGRPYPNPVYYPANISGIQSLKGEPRTTYIVTIKLRNSEGISESVSGAIYLPGPPDAPDAPQVRPESETSVRAAWKEPDNDEEQPITGYEIKYRNPGADDWESWDEPENGGSPVTGYEIQYRKPGADTWESWEEPENGGSPVTGYEIQYQKDGADTWESWEHTGTGTSAVITGLDETAHYDVQIRAVNGLGAGEWSDSGFSSAAPLVVQIAPGPDIISSGDNAVFTVTLSKAATVTVNLSHAWTGGYGESASGTLEFEDETSKKYTLPTAFRGNQGVDGGSVTVSIDTNAAYAIGTSGSATVNITQDSNSQPTLAAPSNQSTGGTYKFPAGKTDGIKYDSEPGTDPDEGTLTYLITFTNPETDTEEEVTIPAEGTTAADLPGTLLTIERSGHNFILKPDGNVTPDQFETTYGEVESHHEEKTLEVQLWASDGTERSPPVDFTLRLHYDPSGYFPEPAVNRSISRWELPDTIETYEGTGALTDTTVTWTSPLAGARNWATGNPATPAFCRHGPGDKDNQDWPAAGNEDSSLFALDTPTTATTSDSGSITFSFKASPDFENPLDSDKDNTYRLRLHNIHSLHQGTEDQGDFPACSGSAIDVTVIVINVNEPPVFPSETDERSVTENTAAGQPIGDPVEAEDPDAGATLTYTLGGDDAASFDIIESTGQLQTKNDLDFEKKASYTVTVTATDREDLSDVIAVTITVTNVDENPTVTGDSTVNYAENALARWPPGHLHCI